MRSIEKRIGVGLALALLVSVFNSNTSQGYDSYVYDSLARSRDALLAQKGELQRAYNDVAGQVDKLNARLGRIDAYLKQVDLSLRDVEDAMRKTK